MPTPPNTLALPVGDRDHIQGLPSARVTLVEYADYECPDCGRAFPLVKAAQKQLGSNLRVAYRHFPLSDRHYNAEAAAELAEAAAAQGKFWAMHDELFANQLELELDNLLVYAKRLRLDLKRVERELENRVYLPRVLEDRESGIRSGVTGTPSFFINGVLFTGDWEDAGLLNALESALTAP